MNFYGDFKHPRIFSRFTRLCLYVGIEVVFIAPRCPWMNGSSENFNKWFEQKFWDKEIFTDLEDMRTKSIHFGGQVHFIRQVNNDGQINVLNEAFSVGKEFISEYVWATICLREQRLEVYYQAQDMDVVLIKELSYSVNEEIRPLGGDI